MPSEDGGWRGPQQGRPAEMTWTRQVHARGAECMRGADWRKGEAGGCRREAGGCRREVNGCRRQAGACRREARGTRCPSPVPCAIHIAGSPYLRLPPALSLPLSSCRPLHPRPSPHCTFPWLSTMDGECRAWSTAAAADSEHGRREPRPPADYDSHMRCRAMRGSASQAR